MANQLVWVDIPVHDLDRAIDFYSAVLGKEIKRQEYPGFKIGLLPSEGEETGGCLYVSPKDKPSDHGPLIYLNVDGRLDEAEAAVARKNGKVLEPKHQIGPHGFRTVILDSEGNRLALHSR
jgi:predicted enzyme related to lactoylglutathione lyase